jgi:hypothetical protein
VDGDRDPHALEGLLLLKSLLDLGQGRHEGPHPLDFLSPGRGQGGIFDIAHLIFLSS